MFVARKGPLPRRPQLDVPEDWQVALHTAAHHPGQLSHSRVVPSIATTRPSAPSPSMQAGPRSAMVERGRLRRLSRLALVAGLLAALGAGAVWLYTGQYWQVRSVAVEGTRDAQVIAAVQALPLTGANILRADTSHDAQLVRKLPMVASAAVRRRYPATLVVQVNVRTPALLWHTGHGDFVLAEDGTVLGPTSDVAMGVPRHLPVVNDTQMLAFGGRAPAPGTALTPGTATLALQLLQRLPSSPLGAAQLQYAGPRGFIAVAPGRVEVYFGNVQAALGAVPVPCTGAATTCRSAGVTRQFAELKAIWATCSQNGVAPRLIDLRWGAHPYYSAS